MKKVFAVLLCMMMCFGSVSALAQYEAPPTKNVLTAYLGFQRVVGVVVEEDADRLSVVITKNNTRDEAYYESGECVVFEVLLKKGNNLLGHRIDAYVKNDGNKNVIIAGDGNNGRNVSITFKPDAIKEFTSEKIAYYKNEEAKATTEAFVQSFIEVKDLDIAVECNVIVNGELNPDFNVYEEYKNLDEITFLDNDNDGDFEFIIVNTEE